MASKVLVKIPTVPFTQTQVNTKNPDIITVNRADDIIISPNKDPSLRVSQLEQNIRFLQEQHQVMLTGLHNEIELLRQRNRDLQFQLVFAKGGVILSSPSSPEDDQKPKIVLTPKQANATPLQIELLEKELAELKLSLQEATTKNTFLSAIVDEQKKKLDTFENEWHQIKVANAPPDDPELQLKLEDADRLIRRLRRENEEQRRELTALRVSYANGDNYTSQHSREHYGSQQARGNGGGNGGGRRGMHRGQREHRFPPLQTQSYWHQGNGRGGRGQTRSERGDSEGNNGSGTTLPSLHNGGTQQQQGGSSGYTASFPNNGGGNGNRKSGGYHGNGNHQYRGARNSDGERKYRGGSNRGSKS